MYERVQIMLSPEQRLRLRSEARARGSSVSALIRDAVDREYGGPSRAERIAAARRLTEGGVISDDVPGPEELKQILAERYDEKYRRLGLFSPQDRS